MSRSFLGIETVPYPGQLIGKPYKLTSPSTYPPTYVKMPIDWNPIWQSLGNPTAAGVQVNLMLGGPKRQLDIIRSVFIDNKNSAFPVSVYFPESGYSVTAAPNTALWYPCIVADMNAFIFIEGLTAGNIPTTDVYFTNVLIEPYSDPEINQSVELELASANISRGTTIFNTNFGVPALGDQVVNYADSYDSTVFPAVVRDNLMNTPYASGFLYLTHVFITTSFAAAGGFIIGGTWQWTIVTDTGDVLFTIEPNPIVGQSASNVTVLDLQKMNLKLDATLTYRIVMTRAPSPKQQINFNHTFVFTTNPN